MDAGKFGKEQKDWRSLAQPYNKFPKIEKAEISRNAAVKKVTDSVHNLAFQSSLEDVMQKGIFDSVDFRV